MDVYGLIGHPLGHSFSQRYFSERFRREGIDADYRMWDLPRLDGREDLPDAEGLRGFNVTIPYKRLIIPMLDSIDQRAEAIGAVNVVKVTREADGMGGERPVLRGFNTDADGFRRSIAPLLGEGHHERALVLGTGGAAASVAFALRESGVEPRFVSRHPQEGMLAYDELTPQMVRSYTVIVNATPLGTWPDTDAAPRIPYDGITERHVCHDLVYNPEETLFMRLCAERGARVKNGLDMLHAQAEEAWRIWNS